MSSKPMYDIMNKLKLVEDTASPTPTEKLYESVEPRGDIMEAVKSLEEKYMGFKAVEKAAKEGGAKDPAAVAASIGRKKYGKEKFQKAAAKGKKLGEAAKPDYIDLDKDGDKKESMKKAAKDAKKKTVKEGEYDPAPIDPAAVEKRKRLQAIKDRQEAEREYGDDHKSNVRKVAGKAYGGAAQKDDADDELNEYSQAEYDQAMADFKAKGGKAKQLPPGSAKNPISTASRHIAGKGEAGKGKPAGRGAKTDATGKPVVDVYEKAPPGAKAERMVKHIKKGYAKDGKLTKKEKGIAYATAWKAHNKGQLQESRMIQEGDYFYEKLGKALAEKNPTLDTASGDFVTAVRQEMVAQGIEPNRARNIIMMDDDFISDVATSYGHYCKEIAECGAPMNSHLGGVALEQELDEIAKLAGLSAPTSDQAAGLERSESLMDDDMGEGNAFTGKLAQTPKGSKFKLGDKEFTDTSAIEEEEEMGEGNEFSGALAKAKATGAKEFEVDGKRYTVKEDVTLAADGADDVVSLIRKLAGMDPVSTDPAAAQVAVATTTEPEAVGLEPTDDQAEEIIAAMSGEPDLEEERDIEHLNTPREKYAPVDAAIPSGTDLNRSKEQDPATANKAANPLAVKEDSLWKKYTGMLKDLVK